MNFHKYFFLISQKCANFIQYFKEYIPRHTHPVVFLIWFQTFVRLCARLFRHIRTYFEGQGCKTLLIFFCRKLFLNISFEFPVWKMRRSTLVESSVLFVSRIIFAAQFRAFFILFLQFGR